MEQADFHRLNWVAGQRTVVHCFVKAFLNSRDKFFRNHTTHNGINEFQTWLHLIGLWIWILWSQFKDDIGKLTFTTSLFLINLLVFHISKQSFFVSHLGSTLVNFYFELSLQPVNNDL